MNVLVEVTYLTVVCAVIRFLVGAEGIKFGWVVVKTIARWAVGK